MVRMLRQKYFAVSIFPAIEHSVRGVGVHVLQFVAGDYALFQHELGHERLGEAFQEAGGAQSDQLGLAALEILHVPHSEVARGLGRLEQELEIRRKVRVFLDVRRCIS